MNLRRVSYLILLSLTCASFVAAQPFQELTNMIKAKRYAEAYELASGLSEKESGNAEFDMLYGVAARETKNADVAIFAFERVIMQNPKFARAHYELGRALFDVSDFKGAQNALNRCLKLNPAANVRDNAIRLLDLIKTALSRQSPITSVNSATVSVGFNSNANGSSTEVNLEPPRGPAQQDGFVNVLLAGRVQRNFSKSDVFYFSLSDVYRKNFSSPTFDYNVATAGLGYFWLMGSTKFTIPYNLSINMVNYRIAFFSNRIGLDVDFDLGHAQIVGVGAALIANNHTNAVNNQISTRIHARYQGLFASNKLALGAELYYDPVVVYSDNPAVGPSVRNELGFSTNFRYEFIKAHLAQMKAGYENLRYLAVPFGETSGRNDHSFSAQASYTYQINSLFALGGTYNFVYRLGDKAENTYVRHEAYLSASATF